MSWPRIKTVLLHSWYHAMHSPETWADLVWFTFINILVFGLLSKVLGQNSQTFVSMLMLGYVFWEIIRVAQYSVSISILWEIWAKSFSSLFITPLTLAELMVGQMISATVKTFMVFLLTAGLSALFFNFSVFLLGPMLLLYGMILLWFAFAAGIFITGMLFRYGTNLAALAWSLIYIVQPISAVFYPVEALPASIRWISYLSPVTYVMESSRSQLSTGNVNWAYLGLATLITAFYFIASWRYMDMMYTHSKRTGSFARLGN